MKRSNNLFDAMEARGYDGELRMIEEHYEQNSQTILLIGLLGAFMLAVTVWIKVCGIVYI